jgi:starch-binding outer membrane protein, SusD/RagB family
MKKHSSLMSALVMVGALAITGCDLDDLLSVQPANLIPATELESPANAALLVNGAAADFDCAFNSFAAVTALISGELVDATQTADRWPYHQRTVVPGHSRYSTFSCVSLGLYQPLQASRASANNIRRLMEGWTDVQVPNRQLLIARAAAYEGWSQLFLAEVFQETVFSSVSGEKVNWGTIITRSAALDSAIATLGLAISTAQAVGGTVADSIRHFALAGRARAQHDKAYNTGAPDAALLAAARNDAALVPAAFEWRATASGTVARRNNRIFDQSNPTVTQQSASVGVYYRTNGRQTGSTTGDPRIPVQNMNRASQGTAVPQWAQLKYTAVSSPIPVVTGREMQLLIAEVDRTAANCATSTQTIINTFRTAGGQTPYVACTSPAADLAEIQDQRRRSLWLQGTYLADVIRYNLTLDNPQGTATPWGQQYGPHQGSAQLLPLPDVERLNNPRLN